MESTLKLIITSYDSIAAIFHLFNFDFNFVLCNVRDITIALSLLLIYHIYKFSSERLII